MATKIEFNEEKAEEYDDHPMVKCFPPLFHNLLNSWDWYKTTQPLNVLDYGCGTGLNTFAFAKQGHIVTAADVSPHMLDKLRIKLEASPLKESISLVQVGPPSEVEWWKPLVAGQFDVIFVIAVLHHVAADQQPGVIASLSKLLKVGGRICIIEFEDTERSRAARGSFHHQGGHEHHQHGEHRNDRHHNHDHNHQHHTDHEHGHQNHQKASSGSHDEKGAQHNHDWLNRDGLAAQLQQNGLNASDSQLFEVPISDEHTLDCFYMIGKREI
jgi:SAM-dependent methyltransferase